ncbi:unnamed protein product [Ranitomeya imitator]|uniref:Uncharacterized protein n=1 Tax=Ranitomeya imitator TaxID=111125 RepID=A0ABN9LKD6_9NEOB|nr:unnamed protein product [Ranitomeya imitator]
MERRPACGTGTGDANRQIGEYKFKLSKAEQDITTLEQNRQFAYYISQRSIARRISLLALTSQSWFLGLKDKW